GRHVLGPRGPAPAALRRGGRPRREGTAALHHRSHEDVQQGARALRRTRDGDPDARQRRRGAQRPAAVPHRTRREGYRRGPGRTAAAHPGEYGCVSREGAVSRWRLAVGRSPFTVRAGIVTTNRTANGERLTANSQRLGDTYSPLAPLGSKR